MSPAVSIVIYSDGYLVSALMESTRNQHKIFSRSRTHKHTHTHTKRERNLKRCGLIYCHLYLRVADMFFALICTILSLDYKFLVLEFRVNNVIFRINDVFIILW